MPGTKNPEGLGLGSITYKALRTRILNLRLLDPKTILQKVSGPF